MKPKPRMRQLRSGYWYCWTGDKWGSWFKLYCGLTAWDAYWGWLKNQRYVVVKSVGDTDYIDSVDVSQAVPSGQLRRALMHE